MTRFPLALFASLLTLTSASQAQTPLPPPDPKAGASCEVIADAIIPLKPPTFDNVMEWKRVLGQEGPDRISDLMALADGGLVTVGDSASYSREGGAKPAQLYVIRTDKTGKPAFEKRIPIKNFIGVAGGAVLKDQIVVASHLRDDKDVSTAQIDFMDGTGTIKKTVTISDPVLSFVPADIVANADSTSVTLAITAVSRKDVKDTFTILYRIDASGTTLGRREYLPGFPNRIEQLQRLPNGQIVGAGRIRIDGVREGGWLLKVTKYGDLITQRPYARGGQAQLIKVIDDRAGGMYAFGEAIPADGGYRAAWIMHLDDDGGILWQRFLTAKYRYSAVDGIVQKDGKVLVLMAGRPGNDGGREHARIISMSSLGNILQDEAYLEGSNAIPTRIIEHSVTKQRFLAGYAQTGFSDYGIPAGQKLATYDAWIAGLVPLPAYVDVCRPGVKETLDDDL